MSLSPDQQRAVDSLTGLSVGDAFGDQFFLLANRDLAPSADLPTAPWEWSDDTEMACSIVDVSYCGWPRGTSTTTRPR